MASDSPERVALLPIKPRYAESIIKGVKKVEFRKVKFRSKVLYVVVYASSPTQKILGYFEISKIEEASPDNLWPRYGRLGGISYQEFKEYFSNSSRGVAIGVGKVYQLPMPLPLSRLGNGFIPPQSFRYLPSEAFELLLNHARS